MIFFCKRASLSDTNLRCIKTTRQRPPGLDLARIEKARGHTDRW